jgi:DNA-binding MarR family transcriptional regulator
MTAYAPNTLALVTQLSRSVYREVSEAGVVPNLKHYITLSHLRELGAVTQQQLGRILCIDQNNTVLVLNEMEAAGLVIRRRDPSDRRRHVVEVTEAGVQSLQQTVEGLQAIQDQVLAALSPEQREQFHALLHQALHGPGGVLEQSRGASVAASAV